MDTPEFNKSMARLDEINESLTFDTTHADNLLSEIDRCIKGLTEEKPATTATLKKQPIYIDGYDIRENNLQYKIPCCRGYEGQPSQVIFRSVKNVVETTDEWGDVSQTGEIAFSGKILTVSRDDTEGNWDITNKRNY